MEKPRKADGFAVPRPAVVAKANAPRLGMVFPYAPVANGAPRPNANGGKTFGAPSPFTKLCVRTVNKRKIKYKLFVVSY